MTLVVDASLVVSALVDAGPVGQWAEELLRTERLAAPHLVLVETANVIRRAELTGEIPPSVAAMCHADMVDLAIDLFPYEPLADRIWELRDSVNAYDAWYVALAEALDVPLATLDMKLVNSPGPDCRFITTQ